MSFNPLLKIFLLPLLFLLVIPSSYAESIRLKDGDDHVIISPQTLSIRWNQVLLNDRGLKVNQKTPSDYQLLEKTNHSASWVLRPSGVKVSAVLINKKLNISLLPTRHEGLTRTQPLELDWFNLNQKEANTLLLPFSEGMRVPLTNKKWANFLVEHYSGSNTTQDLKMPFWTVEQNDLYVNYLLLTPTNNRLTFSQAEGKIDMLASHEFTVLNQHEAFKLQISLGKDWLSGAVAYRDLRQQLGLRESLKSKVARNPEVKKLIGASHVYLFGKGPLSTNDVKDWWGLKEWYLTQPQLTVPQSVQKELASFNATQKWFSQYHKQLLIDSISQSLLDKFNVPYPTLKHNRIAEQYHAAQSISAWLSKHAGQYLIPSQRWGQALSSDMLNSFQEAGLHQLWLGFDNWMPSFYSPEIIDHAKQQGYLVGVYDSYNTAIEPGHNDGWITANMPEEMRQGCAIELASGKKKSGFRNNGYYLNPNCHLEYVKRRMLDIAHYGRFNSLFLDVDGTAMAREDYRDGSNESDMLEAFNDRLDWLSKQKDIVLGSEDGNSLTSSGMAFAHGLETVGFGWVDADMTKNKNSKYYLGRWYPDHKPEYFFQSAQVKEPYRSLLFEPQYRVPLYQTVFHDEIINSHHWHSDSLKFSDVKRARDLTAMLYNTPAMVHLTRDEALHPTSYRILELKHYQDGFEPIHKKIWDQALTDFSWLDTDGRVQQTIFQDGTRITVNFLSVPFVYKGTKIEGYSVKAELSDGKVVDWKAQ